MCIIIDVKYNSEITQYYLTVQVRKYSYHFYLSTISINMPDSATVHNAYQVKLMYIVIHLALPKLKFWLGYLLFY